MEAALGEEWEGECSLSGLSRDWELAIARSTEAEEGWTSQSREDIRDSYAKKSSL